MSLIEYIKHIAEYFRDTLYEPTDDKEFDTMVYDVFIKELTYKLILYRIKNMSIISETNYHLIKDIFEGKTTMSEEKLKLRDDTLPDIYLILNTVRGISLADFDILMYSLNPVDSR